MQRQCDVDAGARPRKLTNVQNIHHSPQFVKIRVPRRRLSCPADGPPRKGRRGGATGEATPRARPRRCRRTLPQGNAPFAGVRGRALAQIGSAGTYEAVYVELRQYWQSAFLCIKVSVHPRFFVRRTNLQNFDIIMSSSQWG